MFLIVVIVYFYIHPPGRISYFLTSSSWPTRILKEEPKTNNNNNNNKIQYYLHGILAERQYSFWYVSSTSPMVSKFATNDKKDGERGISIIM